MAIEYIIYFDSEHTPEEVQSLFIKECGYVFEDDFRHFKCMNAVGVQAQVEYSTTDSGEERIFSLRQNNQNCVMKSKFEIFFSLAKDDLYEAGKVNMVKAIVALLEKNSGDALFFNLDNLDAPLLVRYKNKVTLSDDPVDGFWDPQYDPEVLSLVGMEYDFGRPEVVR
jgi:hypothetical protein